MINGLPPVLSSTDLKDRTSVTWYIREADVPGRKSDHIAQWMGLGLNITRQVV